MTPRTLAIDALGEQPSQAQVEAFLAAHAFPLVEGDAVTFVYRDGGADEVTLQHWIYALESSQAFERLGETDLWVQVMELPPESRIEYKFGVRKGERWRWVRDPLNERLARDPFGANSVCVTHGYQEPDWAFPEADAHRGEVHHFPLHSDAFGERRDVGLYLPPRFRDSRRYPLLIVHDGADFQRFTELTHVLDALIARLEISPMIVALSDSPDRLKEYGADPRHGDYIAHELLPALERKLPVREGRAFRGLMGASFGAVATLSTAWQHPGVFGRLMLLSGSFAFADIGRHRRSAVFDPVADFMARFRDEPCPGGVAPAEQLFVACGVYESLIYENRSLIPTLQHAGLEVLYREARDGHNWINWRDRLRDGLSWLFPGPLWSVYE